MVAWSDPERAVPGSRADDLEFRVHAAVDGAAVVVAVAVARPAAVDDCTGSRYEAGVLRVGPITPRPPSGPPIGRGAGWVDVSHLHVTGDGAGDHATHRQDP